MSLPTLEDEVPALPRAPRRIPAARLLSWASAAAFLGLVGAFAWQAGMFASLAPSPAPEKPVVAHPEQVSVGASRYVGSDRERQPYWVEAKSALQDGKDPNRVHLDTVTGELRRVSGEVLALQSANAQYDTKSQVLDLEGNVRIDSKGSYTAEMARARVTVEDKSLDTDVPVTVTFSTGQINANGMKITDDGKRILFFNRVKARFEPQAKEGSAP